MLPEIDKNDGGKKNLVTRHSAPRTHCSEQQAPHSEHGAHIVLVMSSVQRR